MKFRYFLALPFVAAAILASASAEPVKPMTDQQLLQALIGKWEGTCRTWFKPEKMEDESPVSGEFVAAFDGHVVRHVYKGSMHSKPRNGEELLAFNAMTKSFQSAWFDSFHTGNAIMFSQGGRIERGFAVLTEYGVGENEPKWGWRTEYEIIDKDHLTITAYNILPEGNSFTGKGMEYKAVETVYQRVK
ncbi:MAG: DUF1579 family protein [Steroidobacteraceae bacterium]